MKAPASGYICGACPDGYKGDGRNCELVDDLELRCLEIPELQNGYIQDVNDTISNLLSSYNNNNLQSQKQQKSSCKTFVSARD